MKEILEHYGLGLLEMLGMGGILIIIFNCIGNGGVISDVVAKFMFTISG